VFLGTGLESKSSDLDVFEPGESATARFPNLKIWTPADTFVVAENLGFSTYFSKESLGFLNFQSLGKEKMINFDHAKNMIASAYYLNLMALPLVRDLPPG
jgi:hypothetical protein